MADGKAKYWVAIGYPENMREDWKERISDLVEVPYAYCVHDKDVDGHEGDRKVHVHIILAFSNTTTQKHALSVFRELNKTGSEAFNTCKRVISVRNKYDYLIHDTEACRTAGKHLYDPSERIEGNNFDIGLFEQVSLEERKAVRRELAQELIKHEFTNFFDFYLHVESMEDSLKCDIVESNSGFFERLCKGCYHRKMQVLIDEQIKAKIASDQGYAAYIEERRRRYKEC